MNFCPIILNTCYVDEAGVAQKSDAAYSTMVSENPVECICYANFVVLLFTQRLKIVEILTCCHLHTPLFLQ